MSAQADDSRLEENEIEDRARKVDQCSQEI